MMIYILDKDKSVGRSLVRFMRSFGYAAQSFQSPDQFFSAELVSDKSCLILDCDTVYPDDTNIAERIKLSGFRIPVIFISARDNGDVRVSARKHHASAFFTKPVDGQALLDTIRWIMDDQPSH